MQKMFAPHDVIILYDTSFENAAMIEYKAE